MQTNPYERTHQLAIAIEEELKRLNRWSEPLPPSAFENIGAFGMNTMTFEQWIQFILLDRLHEIVKTNGDFPNGSELATYAVRVFDGDPEAGTLYDLLYKLDALIKTITNAPPPSQSSDQAPVNIVPERIETNLDFLPVVYTLLELLPQFTGTDLESQLQNFDMLIQFNTEEKQRAFSELLMKVAELTSDVESKARIEEAAHSVASTGRVAPPYDHEKAMREYREQHRKNYEP